MNKIPVAVVVDDIDLGGPGSGNHGHAGRPGHRGGSLPRGTSVTRSSVSKSTSAKKTSASVAKALREKSERLEPEITKKVKEVVEAAGGKMAGLEFRLKSESSIKEKIKKRAPDFGGVEGAAESITDLIRYTALFDPNSLVDKAKGILSEFEKDWTIHAKNYWRPGNSYNGYNCILKNKQTGVFMELQFHTPQSLEIKEQVHLLYEQARKLPHGAEKDALSQQMVSMWDDLERPVGWETLPGVILKN